LWLEDINWRLRDAKKSFGVYESWLEEVGLRNIARQNYLEPPSVI
jgi:hypothetical protein